MPNPYVPDAIKQLKGTLRKDRIKADQLDVAPYKIPAAPKHLAEAEREIWNGLRKVMNPLGVVGETDMLGFEMMVLAVCKARLYLTSPDVETKTAVLAAKEARTWLREFGLTPSSRHAVKMTGGEEAAKTLDDFLEIN